MTTTTLPPQPPLLVVTDPAADQIITTRVHAFRGTTDPGAVVAVGSSEADVNDQGGWSLDLTLPPGSSATTVVAIDPASQLSTSVRLQLRYEPDTVLRLGGIDGAPCDTPYEEAMRTLTELFGEPSRLSPPGHGAVQAEWSWSGGGLVATFAEWSLCLMNHDGDYLHFMGWELRGDNVGLSFQGIAPGSTVAELMTQVEGDQRESCDESRELGGGSEGCVSLDKESREDGYRFFLSDGMLPPPLFGYANGPDPDTAVILVLASEAPR